MGNQPTGDLTVTGGLSASFFERSTTSISSIPVGGTATFTVAPIVGLVGGDYSTIIQVQNSNITNALFPVYFTVNAAGDPTSGSAGANVTWELVGTTLTISGTGTMDYRNGGTPPANPHLITAVVINSGVQEIGYQSFYEYINLTSVTIPDTVVYIGDQAFAGCSGLLNITIPPNVATIDDYAFSGSGLTSVVFLGNPPDVGDVIFGSSPAAGLTINYPAGNAAWEAAILGTTAGAAGTWHGLPVSPPISGGRTITASGDDAGINLGDITWTLWSDGELVITGSGPMAWWGVSSNVPWNANRAAITSITMNEGITSIGRYAFSNTQINEVVIPDSVTVIGLQSFISLTSLTSANIGVNVTTIEGGAFSGTGLTSITFRGNAPSTVDSNAFTFLSSAMIIYYNPAMTGWDSRPAWTTGFNYMVIP
jgi:hypothetical protein